MDLSNFPERLAELMEDKTSTQLSEELKCSDSTISHYLTGRYLPTLEMVIKLADYFKCTTDYLLGIKENNEAAEFNVCPPFGEHFLKICKEFKTSRYELQKQTHIAESAMRYWVKGKTTPSIVSVATIAKQLNCSVDYLIGREK